MSQSSDLAPNHDLKKDKGLKSAYALATCQAVFALLIACTVKVTLSDSELLCLVATPVHNNLGELWTQMSFLMPSVFSGSDDFQDTFSEAPDIDPDDDTQENEAELLVTNRLHQASSASFYQST